MTAENRLTRFSDRVANYVKYRPRYPDATLQILREACSMQPGTVIADIGSGTGIFTQQLLAAGQDTVFAVEPNDAMRQAADEMLVAYEGFKSIAGTSEATTLPAHSIDLIVAAQAFHWFKPLPTRAEFLRILKPGGYVALVWNARKHTGSAFLEGYTNILKTHCPEYTKVEHGQSEGANLEVLYGAQPEMRALAHAQYFEFAQLRGRFLSSSYSPKAGAPTHLAALQALRDLFERTAVNGKIAFEYETRLYWGQLAS